MAEELLHPSLLIWGSHLFFLPDLKLFYASVEALRKSYLGFSGTQQGSVKHMLRIFKHFLWSRVHDLAFPKSVTGTRYGCSI